MTTYAVVGQPVTREDGPEKVSGKTCYAGDLMLPGMLWGKVLRSPFPHARIVHIDTAGASKLPGVHAVLTGRDLAGMLVGRTLRDTPLLAQEKVRFVGETVAAVAADDVDTAAEALTRIEVAYEELPAIFDPVEAMQPGAPVVHDGSPAYEGPAGPVHPHGNISHQTTWSGGDVEQGFRESDLLFAHTFTTPWVHQGSMEPYACLVAIDEAGRIQVWANNQQPFRLRWQLASALGLPEDRIRVNPWAIGGDFGGKAGAMDVPLAYALAQRVGRPVKMLMDYVEELMAGNPRHPAVITIKSGVKQDGQLWARHTRVVYNGGAYGGVRGALTLSGGRQAGGGPYRIPHFRIETSMMDTNTVPCGSYRAPGEPQAVFAVESHTDMIARAMGIDPYAFRLQNVVQEGDVSGIGQVFRHGRGAETLRRAAKAASWDAPKPGPGLGRGIALGQRPQGRAVSVARVVVDAQGRATLASSVPDTGVGFYSVGRQVVAEDLGLAVAEVGMTGLDTDTVPFETEAAHAALGAAQDVRHQRTHLAAECYVWPQERIVFRHGRVFVDDAPERGVAFHALAARAVATLGHPIVGEMTTTAEEPEVTAYCAQVAEVEVDPDTGQVTVHRIVTAHDVGPIINPLDHQGQIDGAVMQGLGYALMEGLHADEGRIATLSLGEAKIPTMHDIPTLLTVLVASPGGEGPYQGKAIGENPISPVAPAIAHAVYDAVGVRIQDLPITAEKVLVARKP